MSKYKISESKATDLLKEWAEELEVNSDSDDFSGPKGVIATLLISVRKENLTFDSVSREFTYVLFYPIEKKDGSDSETIIKISSTTMERKRVIQEIKDSKKIDQSIALVAESTGLSVPMAGRLKDKDISRISAIASVFLA